MKKTIQKNRVTGALSVKQMRRAYQSPLLTCIQDPESATLISGIAGGKTACLTEVSGLVGIS